AERWNGTNWAIDTASTPANPYSTPLLRHVACPSASLCTAVGDFLNTDGVDVTLAERWNGSAWSIQGTPNPMSVESSALASVACASNAVCTAAGRAASSGYPSALAQRWSGGAWAIQATPDPASGH